MKRQRNTAQMKEQTRNTEVQINEEEIGKVLEKEFRLTIVKMIKDLENRMDKMQESVNKDLEELKNKHTQDKNSTITEIKNTLEGINSRISEAEEQISELEGKMVKITSEEQNKVIVLFVSVNGFLFSLLFAFKISSKGCRENPSVNHQDALGCTTDLV